jgi:hypothetical protein
MALIVQAEAADILDVISGKWSQKETNVGHLVGHSWRAEDVASDNSCSLGFCNVGDAFGKNGVAIVGVAVASEEADKALWGVLSAH